MELAFATRVTIVAGAALLALALIVFGPSPAPALHLFHLRRRPVRRPSLRRPSLRPHLRRPSLRRSRRTGPRRLRSARLMYYVAAIMAVLLGGVVALTG